MSNAVELPEKGQALRREVLNEIETLHAGHAFAMVPGIGGVQVELEPSAWPRPASHFDEDRRSHCPHGARESLVGLLPNPLGHQVGRGTIANIFKENGIEPAPEGDTHTPWSTFLKAH